jgi:hypothetical protein
MMTGGWVEGVFASVTTLLTFAGVIAAKQSDVHKAREEIVMWFKNCDFECTSS